MAGKRYFLGIFLAALFAALVFPIFSEAQFTNSTPLQNAYLRNRLDANQQSIINLGPTDGSQITNLNSTNIQQEGATIGQGLVWNGTAWLPGTVSGGGGATVSAFNSTVVITTNNLGGGITNYQIAATGSASGVASLDALTGNLILLATNAPGSIPILQVNTNAAGLTLSISNNVTYAQITNALNTALLADLNSTNGLLLGFLGSTNGLILGFLNSTNTALLAALAAQGTAITNNFVQDSGTNNFGTNQLNTARIAAENAISNAYQFGSVALSNIAAATGVPSSATFLRGDYTWAAAGGSGTMPNDFNMAGFYLQSLILTNNATNYGYFLVTNGTLLVIGGGNGSLSSTNGNTTNSGIFEVSGQLVASNGITSPGGALAYNEVYGAGASGGGFAAALGSTAVAGLDAIAVGAFSVAANAAVALGYTAATTNSAIAIGLGARANTNDVSIGYEADSAAFTNSMAFGNYVTNTASFQALFGPNVVITGNGSGLTNAAGNVFVDKTITNGVNQSLINAGNTISNGVFQPTNYQLTLLSTNNGANLTNLNAGNLATGTVPTARLGSGSASSSTFLRGDQTWAAAGGSGTMPGNFDMAGFYLQHLVTTNGDTNYGPVSLFSNTLVQIGNNSALVTITNGGITATADFTNGSGNTINGIGANATNQANAVGQGVTNNFPLNSTTNSFVSTNAAPNNITNYLQPGAFITEVQNGPTNMIAVNTSITNGVNSSLVNASNVLETALLNAGSAISNGVFQPTNATLTQLSTNQASSLTNLNATNLVGTVTNRLEFPAQTAWTAARNSTNFDVDMNSGSISVQMQTNWNITNLVNMPSSNYERIVVIHLWPTNGFVLNWNTNWTPIGSYAVQGITLTSNQYPYIVWIGAISNVVNSSNVWIRIEPPLAYSSFEWGPGNAIVPNGPYNGSNTTVTAGSIVVTNTGGLIHLYDSVQNAIVALSTNGGRFLVDTNATILSSNAFGKVVISNGTITVSGDYTNGSGNTINGIGANATNFAQLIGTTSSNIFQFGNSTLSNLDANLTVNSVGQFTNLLLTIQTNTWQSVQIFTNQAIFTFTNGPGNGASTVAISNNGQIYTNGVLFTGGSGGGSTSTNGLMPLLDASNVIVTNATFTVTNSGGFMQAASNTLSLNGINLQSVNINIGVPLLLAQGSNNSYEEIEIQNLSGGSGASADLVVTADNGTESNFFGDFGINSSSNTANVWGSSNDVYLYAQNNVTNSSGGKAGGNLWVGTSRSNTFLVFSVGSGGSNSVAAIDSSGNFTNAGNITVTGQFNGNGSGLTNIPNLVPLLVDAGYMFTNGVNTSNSITPAPAFWPTNTGPAWGLTNYSSTSGIGSNTVYAIVPMPWTWNQGAIEIEADGYFTTTNLTGSNVVLAFTAQALAAETNLLNVTPTTVTNHATTLSNSYVPSTVITAQITPSGTLTQTNALLITISRQGGNTSDKATNGYFMLDWIKVNCICTNTASLPTPTP